MDESQDKSFIYLIPLLTHDNAYNRQLMRMCKRVETHDVDRHILSTIWGLSKSHEILQKIKAKDVHGIVSTFFGRSKNPNLNFFDIQYKCDCQKSYEIAMACYEVASKLSRLPTRMNEAMRYDENGVGSPNPLFEAAGCPGIIVRPCYFTAAESGDIIAQREFHDVYCDTVVEAIMMMDSL